MKDFDPCNAKSWIPTDTRQFPHTPADNGRVVIGRECDVVINVHFRNTGQNSVMAIIKGSNNAMRLRPGEETTFGVGWPYCMRSTYLINYEEENQNPIKADDTQDPLDPATVTHKGTITEIFVTSV